MRFVYCLIAMLLFISCSQTIQGGRATWDEERYGEIEPQQLDNSCGLASLLTIMRYQFGDTRFDERALLGKYIEQASGEALEKALRQGMSILEIEALVQSIGYTTKRKMFTLEELENTVTAVPVLVYLEIGTLRHFAVVRGMSEEVVWLADPARGNVYHSRQQFLAEWRTPEVLRKEWTHPGGLIIVRQEGKFDLNLLKKPISQLPSSFFELRRLMIIGR
jgi:predicted double-glycine peptidase